MKKIYGIRIWKKFGISLLFIFLLSNLRIFMETTDSQATKGKIIYSTKNKPRPGSTTALFSTDSYFIAATIATTEIKPSQFKTNQFISNMDIPFNFLMLRKDFIIRY